METNQFENRASAGNIQKKGEYLEGVAIVFNSMSEPLFMVVDDEEIIFREKIMPESLRNVSFEKVICCADHNETLFLGISPKTLSIEVTERGLEYKCLLPNSMKAVIEERIEREEYTGNSFRFAVGQDSWEKMPDGTFIRTINEISYIRHLGPVFNPAYTQTDVSLAQRSLGVILKAKNNDGQDNESDSIEKLCSRMGYKNLSDYKLKNLERLIKK